MSKKRLGRGLDALLSADRATREPVPTENAPEGSPGAEAVAAPRAPGLTEVAIDEVVTSRYQPRRVFDEQALNELAASIRAQGLMQPVVLRSRPQGGYELIAGERRWRAARIAGLAHIPAVLREVTDEQASAMALIENIQREDLNPLEEAQALDRLKEEFGLTQQQVADAVGKSRVAVTNLLRLLNLSPPVRDMLLSGEIEMGHARALITIEHEAQQVNLLKRIITENLSVRQVEDLVRKINTPPEPAPVTEKKLRLPEKYKETTAGLSEKFGAKVSLRRNNKGQGSIVISFRDDDELDRIISIIDQE